MKNLVMILAVALLLQAVFTDAFWRKGARCWQKKLRGKKYDVVKPPPPPAPPSTSVPSIPDAVAGVSCTADWKIGTATSHDYAENAFMEFETVPPTFYDKWNVTAVHIKDFEAFKYKIIQIKAASGKLQLVEVWDACADKDCNGCCTNNMKSVPNSNFLLDIHTDVAQILFGTKEIREPIQWRTCGRFPKPASL